MNLRVIQKWYEKMAQRERLMFAGFAWAVVLLWGTLVGGQLKTLKKNITQANSDLATQTKILGTRVEVESRLKKVQTDFQNNPISALQLFQMANGFARTAGLNAPITQIPSHAEKVFSVNAVTVTFTKTPLRVLVTFCSLVLQHAPYLAIKELTLRSDKSDPTVLSGEIRVNSLELKMPSSTPPPPSSTAATPQS